ncbi:MAG: hypothetical protein EHM81_08165, partial [Chloroflexi bacterium]
MAEHTGWLIDLYPDETGLMLWLLADAGERLSLRMDFPVTFYAAGDFRLLRQAWRFLQDKGVSLARETRRDLFSGEREVLAITVSRPAALPGLFAELSAAFPALDYYDADVPLPLRFAARTGVGLLGRCQIDSTGNRVAAIEALDSSWELDPAPIPLRVLELSPDVDPALRPPKQVRVRYGRVDYALSLEPFRAFEIALGAVIHQYNPDLLLTDYGDTWLLPKLTFNPNRDLARDVLTRKADSYFAYGQVVYRGSQAHLFGRWHIDRKNAMLFSEYGLEGVLEQARVTGLGAQEMARKSPGAGITAMQMLTALRTGVLVPVVKQQAESVKTLDELIRADKGGMIYQPLIGVHEHVAQIDFASMYPTIMVNFNISPEIKGSALSGATIGSAVEGLIPQTLRPLLEKRLALKRKLSELHPRDCRAKSLKARAAALKWLLVVCFGYLGYKNARFGKIEGHEAVTSISRELLLQAKETAEELGFSVLHMYIDCLFVQKPDCQNAADFASLLAAIEQQTGIPIALEGIYRWVAFLPSKRDRRIPVPNRYFGVLDACPACASVADTGEHGRRDGEIKYRGIELRRHDTPPFVAKVQLAVLQCLAQAATLEQVQEYIPKARESVEQAKRELRAGRVPVEDLVITQRLSREVAAYKSPSPAARAAKQWLEAGKSVAPGQVMKFVFTRGKPGVWAYGCGELDERTVDIGRYVELLNRAAETVIDVLWAKI